MVPLPSLNKELAFTVVEMVIVGCVIAVLSLASYPSMRRMSDTLRLSNQTFEMEQVLREAQAIAFSQQIRCSVVFDVARRSYEVVDSHGSRGISQLERGIDIVAGQCTVPSSSPGKLNVTFTPEYGIPTQGGRIVLRAASVIRKLVISAVTGRVRVE